MQGEEVLKNYSKLAKKYKPTITNVWIETYWPKSLITIPIPAQHKRKKYIPVFLNIITGETKFELPEDANLVDRYACHNFVHMDYIKEEDIIACYSFRNDNCSGLGSTVLDGKPIKLNYKLVKTSFISKDKKMITKIYDWSSKSFSKPTLIEAESTYSLTYYLDAYLVLGYQSAFGQMFGIGFISGNTYTNFEDLSSTYRFLKRKNLVKPSSKKQEIIDELTKIDLSTSHGVNFTKETKNELVCVGEKVNDEYSVLRYFKAKYDLEPYEISRLYVSKKDHIFCRKDLDDNFIVLSRKLSSQSFDANDVKLIGSPFKGTKLEYFEEIFLELDNAQKSAALYTLIQHPEFEKLFKSGYKDICLYYLKESNTSWPVFIEKIFGTPTENKNLFKMLGFNKYQLAKISELYKTKTTPMGYYSEAGVIFKQIFNTSDCSPIDNDTFDKCVPAVKKMLDEPSRHYYLITALNCTTNLYGIKTCIAMLDKLVENANTYKQVVTSHGWTTTQHVLGIYNDYVRLVSIMNQAVLFKPYFDTFEDLKRMHDDLTATYNMQKNKYEADKFSKQVAKYDKYLYDEDEKYIIIVPKLPEDLAYEGITLHHCVKSYIGRVANGETNIVFIREKDNIKTPFFTVEVSNSGSIEQVHGFANRNVSTEPGLDIFVKKWAKACKLKLTNFNKVR